MELRPLLALELRLLLVVELRPLLALELQHFQRHHRPFHIFLGAAGLAPPACDAAPLIRLACISVLQFL